MLAEKGIDGSKERSSTGSDLDDDVGGGRHRPPRASEYSLRRGAVIRQLHEA